MQATFRGRAVWIAMVGLALFCAIDTGIARAVVRDLSQASLKASDAPPGYYGPVVKAYHHPVDRMEAGGRACNLYLFAPPSDVGRWQGQIQTFQAKNPMATLLVCSFLLYSDHDARKTYERFHKNVLLLMGGEGREIKASSKIGDGATATFDTSVTMNGKAISAWRLAFRHGLAVILIEVDQPKKGFTSASLYHLGSVINSRLH